VVLSALAAYFIRFSVLGAYVIGANGGGLMRIYCTVCSFPK
jgi:hypothetical protein